ncbi:DUF5667 domain-containing protein [Chloroflexota bacterium]
MKRKEFDNILSDCLERLLDGEETLEQCLVSYPEQVEELRPLLEMSLAAKQASAVSPRPEFRARAREQFQAALREMPVVSLEEKPAAAQWEKSARWLFLPRWATAVAAVFILLLGGSGMVVAASNSMPDGFLYTVKLATEQVWLAFTPSDMGKVEVYARLADRRVDEIASIVGSGDLGKLEDVAGRLDEQLAMIITLAGGAPVAEDAGAAEAGIMEQKSPVLGATPVPAPTPTWNALEAPPADGLGQERYAVASTPDDTWSEFQKAMARDAVDNPAKLRTLLEMAPESVRSALLEVIAAAEVGYQQALSAVTSGAE